MKHLFKIKILIACFLCGSIFYAHTSTHGIATSDDSSILIEALLDGLHSDAHEGNFEAYFARYSSNAVFLGTDKNERWTIEEFKAYAKPAFADGHGWTYDLVERNWEGVGDIRWFDEILFNEKLGHCRGTGVVHLINGEWKIAHYALTMLVPNEIALKIGSQTIEADKK
ncbi:MAG: nuclear transport factor 2 family protein [Pseudomonadota bacterium]|nr:nuclear transport factor 2 family protein [Pseudomonadota bacterium]